MHLSRISVWCKGLYFVLQSQVKIDFGRMRCIDNDCGLCYDKGGN